MARLFMAGVASVDMFDGDKLFATANTLTDSSLNIGISAEDVRGGEGAGLLGKYYHTSTFELTLTDALFNLNYVAASVGAEMQAGGNVIMNEQKAAEESGKITLSKAGIPLNGCDGVVYGWYRLATEENYKSGIIEGNVLNGADIIAGNTYCVKYFYAESAAETIRINANYVPKTLHLVLKESLYAAGDNNNSQTKVGYIVIDIPRFQLDGSQELSMNMNGAATTSLKGSALISDGCNAGCEGAGYYAEMTQVLDGAKWYDGATALAVDGGAVTIEASATKDIALYAIYSNKTPKLITADMLEGLNLEVSATAFTINGLTVTNNGDAGSTNYGTITLSDNDGFAVSGAITVITPAQV